MNEENIQIIKNAYLLFGRGDIQGILDLLTDDVHWQTPDVDGVSFYGEKHGKQGALEFFQGLGASETAEAFEQNEFLADADKVIVLGRWASTVNATGRHWETDLVHIFTIRDGKIAAMREFFDSAAATRAFQSAAAA